MTDLGPGTPTDQWLAAAAEVMPPLSRPAGDNIDGPGFSQARFLHSRE